MPGSGKQEHGSANCHMHELTEPRRLPGTTRVLPRGHFRFARRPLSSLDVTLAARALSRKSYATDCRRERLAKDIFHDLVIFAGADKENDRRLFVQLLNVAIKRLEVERELAQVLRLAAPYCELDSHEAGQPAVEEEPFQLRYDGFPLEYIPPKPQRFFAVCHAGA